MHDPLLGSAGPTSAPSVVRHETQQGAIIDIEAVFYARQARGELATHHVKAGLGWSTCTRRPAKVKSGIGCVTV